MKKKKLKKMLALMLAAMTVSATPGLVAAVPKKKGNPSAPTQPVPTFANEIKEENEIQEGNEIKEENEKKIGLLNLDVEQYKDKIKELNEEIEKSKEKNKNHFTKLTNDIINEKLKHKNIEERMNNLLNLKKADQEIYHGYSNKYLNMFGNIR